MAAFALALVAVPVGGFALLYVLLFVHADGCGSAAASSAQAGWCGHQGGDDATPYVVILVAAALGWGLCCALMALFAVARVRVWTALGGLLLAPAFGLVAAVVYQLPSDDCSAHQLQAVAGWREAHPRQLGDPPYHCTCSAWEP